MALLGPDGEPIELDGVWIEAPGGSDTTWWIRTDGDCVWGSGHVTDIEPDIAHHVQSLNGRIRSDFAIVGDILFLGPIRQGAPAGLRARADLHMLIEFQEGGDIVIREDREPGAIGPHCPVQDYCPAPLVLERAD
jgi:hypothetical protein